MIPWTEEYRPKKLREIAGQFEAQKKVLIFIKNFKNQGKRALLLHGPAGSGKTSIVYALASDLGYEILEMNASDFRNKEQVKAVVGGAVRQQSLFSKGKIILVDELDGISGSRDRGGLKELIRIIQTASWPIVLVANDAWQVKLRPLRYKAQFIELKALDNRAIFAIINRIAKKEKLNVSGDILRTLATMSRGDARAAITDLQVLASTCKSGVITKKEATSLCNREKDESIFEALRLVFKSRNGTLGAFDQVKNINFEDLFLWLDENLPREYQGQELARAYEALSKADVFRGRIRRRQHWRFLVYIMALLTQGISTSRKQAKKDFTSYKPPSRILKMWWAKQKLAKRKQESEVLARVTHTSKKRAFKEHAFLDIAFKGTMPFTNL